MGRGLTKADILGALEALAGALTAAHERHTLVVVGGAAMVLLYGARESTKDVDAVALGPSDHRVVYAEARRLAGELGLPEDWLNDGAKGYLQGIELGQTILSTESLVVWAASVPQLLAMKLSAWRDDVDVGDARLLLSQLQGDRDEVWRATEPFVVPGRELKARYAFADLWEAERGDR
jgi:predicted nucleotidyltransferase